MDLLGSYDADDLTPFEKQAKTIEEYIVSEINNHGVGLRRYDSLEDFLKDQG